MDFHWTAVTETWSRIFLSSDQCHWKMGKIESLKKLSFRRFFLSNLRRYSTKLVTHVSFKVILQVQSKPRYMRISTFSTAVWRTAIVKIKFSIQLHQISKMFKYKVRITSLQRHWPNDLIMSLDLSDHVNLHISMIRA